jgi:transposase-like protein/IS1 family transposase
MICPTCQAEAHKHGRDRKGNQRFYCASCSKSFTDPSNRPIEGMYLSSSKVNGCLRLLLEGCSLRSVERLTGVSLHTLLKLLVEAGKRCEKLLEEYVKGIKAEDIECDEIWCFVGMKEKTLKGKTTKGLFGDDFEKIDNYGDAYTFVGFERNTKLVLAWHLGKRTFEDTYEFTKKLSRATTGRFQVSTDGFAPYRDTITHEFLDRDIDFAQLTKIYAAPQSIERKYSPPVVVDIITSIICGNPDKSRISTSLVERQNLTIRMQMRRFTSAQEP